MKKLGSLFAKLKFSPRSKPEYPIFLALCLENIADFAQFYYYTTIAIDDRIGMLPLVDQGSPTTKTGMAVKCEFCDFYTKPKYLSKHVYDSHDGFQCRLCKKVVDRNEVAGHRGECDISNLGNLPPIELVASDEIKNNLAKAVLGDGPSTLKHLASRSNLSSHDLEVLHRVRQLPWIPDVRCETPHRKNPTNSLESGGTDSSSSIPPSPELPKASL